MFRIFFSNHKLPVLSLVVVIITGLYTLWFFQPWKQNEGGRRGVIKWDVITYYSYLPATIIHDDFRLDFLDDQTIVNDNKYWPIYLENGNKLIVTSMGLSFMYAPFFLVAHALAPLLGQANDGFSNIYQFMLLVSGFFYAILGLILLARFLRKHFDPLVTGLTVLALGLGTNLYFYFTVEAAMPHSHNFFLITAFMLYVIHWYRNPAWHHAIGLGLLFGLIVLVRPTNVLLFLFLFLFGVTSGKGLLERVRFYLSRWYLVVMMILAFLIPWVPQFLYWKAITGQYLFFSYGEKGASFFFGQPQILQSLFHIRKGLLVYVPIMLFALAGIPMLYRNYRHWFVPLVIYVPLMIYVQSSWWCWWFGGGYGLRPYISMYPLLAFPLALFLQRVRKTGTRVLFSASVSLVILLIAYQVFQTRQFTTGAIHYSGTTTRSYYENFLKTYPTGASWKMLELPDFTLSRLGIHVTYPTWEDKEAWKSMDQKKAFGLIRKEVTSDRRVMRQIRRYAGREGIPVEEAMDMVIRRMYEEKID